MNRLIQALKNIINPTDDNPRPSRTDELWKPVPDSDCYSIKSNNYYTITEPLVKLMEKYTKIYRSLNTPLRDQVIQAPNDNIAVIYIAENDATNEKYVGYTTNSMPTFIRLNMHYYNLDKDSVFDNFEYNSNINKSDTLDNFSFETIEYFKYSKRQDLLDRKRHYTKLYLNNNQPLTPDSNSPKDKIVLDTKIVDKVTKDDIDKLYEKRIELFYDILKPQERYFKPFVGYIYQLINNTEPDKKFIVGYNQKLSKNFVLDKIIEANNKLAEDVQRLGRKEFNLVLLETFHAKCMYDFLLRIDYWIIKKNANAAGYNNQFNMEESDILYGPNLLTRKKNQLTRSFYLRIQKFLISKYFDDKLDYSDVYAIVYQIQNNKTKERYISYAFNKTFKDLLYEFYNNALKGNIKRNKLLKALMEYPYDNFTFSVLKIKKIDDKKIDIIEEAEKFVKRFKSVEKGYNANKNS